MEIAHPYLLFLGDVGDQLAAKTASGIVDWRKDWVIGQLRLEGCKADTGVGDVTISEAKEKGAKTMVIGVVNSGGVLPSHWVSTIVNAIEAGMDIASGLHIYLSDIPEIAEAAEKHGAALHDVRQPKQKFPTGKGIKRPGHRLLTIGTDCSVGKKYASLALERDMRKAGFNADFRATGQTGLFISGRGTSIDAVVADFIAGAAEWISPAADESHWDVIEGQGSLFHPAFSGVTLGLLHGSQPDAVVICHEPTRKTMRGVDHPLPTIGQVIEAATSMGRLNNPDIQAVGIAVNTSALEESEAKHYLEVIEQEYNLPTCDPIRWDGNRIVENLKELYPNTLKK